MSAAPANGQHQRRGASPDRKHKVLPHDISCEASILGGIILRNSTLRDLETLETNDFYDHKHKIVFEAIRNLQASKKPIDVVTLEAEIERTGKLDALGGIAFLGELALRVPTSDNVVAYAKVVRDHALVRKTILLASEIAERGYDWKYDADELLGELVGKGQEIDRGYRESNDRLPILTVGDSLDELERLARTPIFETPFVELNKAIGFGGLLAGQVYYLAGGTGFGKTSFIATIVRHHAEQGRPALIAFWEMFSGYYTARMAAGVLGVHANRILRGEVSRSAVQEALPPDRISFLDSPALSTLSRAVEQIVRVGNGPPLIVIDYIQLLAERVLATMPRPDARLATSQASAELRELAKKTGAAIICVTAAGRSASKKLAADVRKMPARDLIDASKESGSIEFDGAGVIVLSVSEEKDGDESIATITVAKARFGETTHIDARYAGHTGAWRSLDRVLKVTKAITPPDDGSMRKAICAVIKLHGPSSRTNVAKLCGHQKQAALTEIRNMVNERVLVELKGRIALPEHAPIAPDLQAQIDLAEAVPEAVPEGES